MKDADGIHVCDNYSTKEGGAWMTVNATSVRWSDVNSKQTVKK